MLTEQMKVNHRRRKMNSGKPTQKKLWQGTRRNGEDLHQRGQLGCEQFFIVKKCPRRLLSLTDGGRKSMKFPDTFLRLSQRIWDGTTRQRRGAELRALVD